MKKNIFFISILLIIIFLFFNNYYNNDTMKPEDFKGTEPTINIEKYFEGPVKAWGLLQDRKAKLPDNLKQTCLENLKIIYLLWKKNFFGQMVKNKRESGK